MPHNYKSIVGLKHESAYLRAESARPFFQVEATFSGTQSGITVTVYLYIIFLIYIFDAVISKCPLQPLFHLPKSKVGLMSGDEEAGARKPIISFLSFYLRGKEKRFRY